MQDQDIKKFDISAIVFFLLGCLGLITVIALDKLYFKKSIFAEGWPNFSVPYAVRSTAIFISIVVLFWGLIGKKRPRLVLFDNNRMYFERSCILATLSASLAFLFLFLFSPSDFGALCLEDGLIEWGSALLLFISCIIFFYLFIKHRNNSAISKIILITSAVFALIFFIMAMEEVSWFQRVLEIKTPELFKNSNQNEINLHNIKTNYVENLYYFGSFLFLVAFPFLRWVFPYLSSHNYLNLFMARPYIGIIGSVACAYNFDMWNVIFTQMAFFGSGVILVAFAMFSTMKNDRFIVLLTFCILIATQTLFLIHGEKFSRLWDVTEYKEFLIPLVFCIYALDVFNHLNRVYSSNRLAVPP